MTDKLLKKAMSLSKKGDYKESTRFLNKLLIEKGLSLPNEDQALIYYGLAKNFFNRIINSIFIGHRNLEKISDNLIESLMLNPTTHAYSLLGQSYIQKVGVFIKELVQEYNSEKAEEALIYLGCTEINFKKSKSYSVDGYIQQIEDKRKLIENISKGDFINTQEYINEVVDEWVQLFGKDSFDDFDELFGEKNWISAYFSDNRFIIDNVGERAALINPEKLRFDLVLEGSSEVIFENNDYYSAGYSQKGLSNLVRAITDEDFRELSEDRSFIKVLNSPPSWQYKGEKKNYDEWKLLLKHISQTHEDDLKHGVIDFDDPYNLK